MIEVSCPCGYLTQIDDKHAGKSFTCPKCKSRGHVPSFDCPKCSNPQTQSISVIHAGGTSVSESRTAGLATGLLEDTPLYVGFATTTTAQQTDLARRFAPPVVKADLSLTPSIALGIAGLTIAIAFLIVIFFGAMPNIEPRGEWDLTRPLSDEDARQRTWELNHPADGGNIAVAAMAVVGGIVWAVAGFLYLNRIFVPWLSQRQRDAEQVLADKRWVWDRSYFCHRCGQVFVPAHLASDPKPVS